MAAINADLQGRAALCGPVMRLGVRQEADSRETRDAAALGAAASYGRDEGVKERIKEHKIPGHLGGGHWAARRRKPAGAPDRAHRRLCGGLAARWGKRARMNRGRRGNPDGGSDVLGGRH